MGKKPTRVFSIGDLEVWGGSLDLCGQAGEPPDFFLAVNGKCPGCVREEEALILNEGNVEQALRRLPDMGGLRAIVVEWPDYGVPSFVTRSHWEVLANYLREKVGRLYVGCDGGLGRTGTTLAILAGLWRLTDSPVTFVRERYDPHAVETPEQEAYVTSMMPPGR